MAWWPNSMALARSVPFTECASLLHHHDEVGALGCRDDDIDIAVGHLGKGRVHDELTAYPSHPDTRERPVMRISDMVTAQDAPTRLRTPGSLSWSAESTVEITLRLVSPVLREQRPQRPVDEAR